MSVKPTKPDARADSVRFATRLFIWAAMIALVWWLGWRSPWSRTDMTVKVEATDPPPARPPLPALPAGSPSVSPSSAGDEPTASEHDTAGPAAKSEDNPEPTESRHVTDHRDDAAPSDVGANARTRTDRSGDRSIRANGNTDADAASRRLRRSRRRNSEGDAEVD